LLSLNEPLPLFFVLLEGLNLSCLTMAARKKRVSKTVRVGNELGLHARAAARVAELAKQAGAKIWLLKDGQKVDAASIIDILTLGGHKGARIILSADDPADTDTLNKIETLFKDNFGE